MKILNEKDKAALLTTVYGLAAVSVLAFAAQDVLGYDVGQSAQSVMTARAAAYFLTLFVFVERIVKAFKDATHANSHK